MGYVHVTKTGVHIPIEHMDEAHLLNTITMYKRKLAPYLEELGRRKRKPNLKDIVRNTLNKFKPRKRHFDQEPDQYQKFLDDLERMDLDPSIGDQ